MKYDYKNRVDGRWETVDMSAETLRFMLKGEKINAIKQVRSETPEIRDENGEYVRSLGLKDAMECIECWEADIWPGGR